MTADNCQIVPGNDRQQAIGDPKTTIEGSTSSVAETQQRCRSTTKFERPDSLAL